MKRHAVQLLCALHCMLATTTVRAEGNVALNFLDVDLSIVARFVSETTGRNFILDEVQNS